LALVIGNDAYRDVEPLQTARADATAMAKALEGVGFKVSLRLDVDDRALKAAVRQFKAQLAAGDDAVFFYAGHGVQFGSDNYLVPVNVGIDDEEQIRDESVPLRRVLEDLQDVKARFSLAIIDACRNNPFRTRSRAGAARGLIPAPAATGQMVIYSAGAGQAAIDRLGKGDRDPNGLFTRVLLREITAPGIPVDRVVRKVRDQVVALARSVGHEQVPAIYDQTIGDFFFVPAATVQAAVPATLTAPPPTPTPTPTAAPTPAPSESARPPATTTSVPRLAAAALPSAQPDALAVSGRAGEPAPELAVLQALAREQANLKMGRALTLLLEPDTALERGWIDSFAANVERLRYRSALAVGPVAEGRLQIGVGQARDLDRIAQQEAMDFCAGTGPRGNCRLVFTSGRFDAAAFVEAVRAGVGGGDLNAYRYAWRRVLGLLERNPNFPVR
jgi:hypothetical protein